MTGSAAKGPEGERHVEGRPADEPPLLPEEVPEDALGPDGREAVRREERVRMTAWVRGRVQGVGFRWFTRANARRVGGLVGFVRNLDDGRVQVVAEGPGSRCEALLEWLREGDTPGEVTGVTEIWQSVRGGYDGFAIR